MAKTSKKKPVKKSELEISRKNEIIMGLQVCEARERLDTIAQIIENVDNRCMAADGPVTPTLQEMTQEEIKEIYELAKLHVRAKQPLQVIVRQWRSNHGDYTVAIKKGVQFFRMDYTGDKQACEWMAHMLRLALSSGDAGKTQDILQDAGCMIRRLVHRFRQQGRDSLLKCIGESDDTPSAVLATAVARNRELQHNLDVACESIKVGLSEKEKLQAEVRELREALEEAHMENVGLTAYLETCSPEVIVENLPTLVASLQRKRELIEGVLARVKE